MITVIPFFIPFIFLCLNNYEDLYEENFNT